MKKFDTIIFDLDGVLVDSKINMKKSWQKVKKKMKLNQSFNDYFNFIGYPFEKILEKIGIFHNISNIKRAYSQQSLNNIKFVKKYKDILKTIQILKKKKIKLAIVTSKDYVRAKKILKRLKIPIRVVICPKRNLNGKPSPDQILVALKKLNSIKKNTCYIGDMFVDYKTAKNAKINFIFANYGYGKKKSIYNKIIRKPKDVLKFTA
tara:strand:- start:14740 stop:15357 length:618 start_codon:yes stop_codon:yes gene_type:complete